MQDYNLMKKKHDNSINAFNNKKEKKKATTTNKTRKSHSQHYKV